MKKFAVLVVLFSITAINVQAQLFDLSNNEKDFSIGLNIGVVGYHFNGKIDKTYSGFGVGGSVSVKGIYMDFIYQSPEHRYSRKVAPMIYNDHTALTINLGYKLPVTSWLNITPLIGYSNETQGKTDCSTINIDYQNHSVYHDYDREHIQSHFNYGLGISVRPIKFLEIGGVCTAHAVYGNISLSLKK